MSDSNITKKALADAMKELMQEKKFEKISVTDICDRCGMNRKSFYYHFRDKYDLVNWIFYIGFIENFDMATYEKYPDEEGELKNPEIDTWKLASDMCNYFYRERAFYKKALMIEGQNSFKDYFHDAIFPMVQLFLSDILVDDYGDFFVTSLCDMIISMLVRWITSPNTEPPESLMLSLSEMVIRLSKRIVEEDEKNRNSPNYPLKHLLKTQ